MSDDPKTKNSEKIKFFKIDREGDIAPAFPPNVPPSENSFARIEPMLTPIENGAPPGDAVAPETPEPMWESALPEIPQSPAAEPAAEETNALARPLSFSQEELFMFSEEQLNVARPPSASESKLEVHIDALKPQVDTINRMHAKQDLTVDQVEVLRKYISLKEAEVRDLRDQRRQYENFARKVTSQVEGLGRRNRDLLTEVEMRKREEGSLKSELRDIKDRHAGEIVSLRNEYEDRLRRRGNYDAQAEEFHRKREEWKEKVREELKRIKLKEKELENKHELLKRDMQALLDSKDKHVLELKKKNDALELEMESLEDRLRRANLVMAAIDSKKRRLVETMKLAIALLEGIDAVDRSEDDESRKAG